MPDIYGCCLFIVGPAEVCTLSAETEQRGSFFYLQKKLYAVIHSSTAAYGKQLPETDSPSRHTGSIYLASFEFIGIFYNHMFFFLSSVLLFFSLMFQTGTT